MPRQLLGTAIAANTITTTQLQTTIVQNIEGGGGPRVTSLIYPGDDTAANTVGGQTVYINGSGFASNSAVYINGNSAPSVSFISSSNLAITTPALSAATYPVYVINPENGATAIFIPGLLVSGDPTWVTSAGSLSASQDASSAWSYSVSATSDSAVTYALASGSSLPTGISLAANGLISGTMSSPPESETTYNFTVEAIDAENQNATRAFSVTVSTGEGVLFANNVLLIHADGTNNQNNHHFLDSSNNNLTITRAGNATQGSFSPFSQTGWSGYFDGTGDYLTLASNAAFAYGTGAFTIEAWVYLTGDYSIARTILGREAGDFNFYITPTNGYLAIYTGSAQASTTAVSRNKWVHVAVVREGTGANQTKLYVDGVSVHSFTNSTNFSSTANYIGLNVSAGSDYWSGYISNLRIVKGTALYTGTFTPPSAPLAPIANTSLLALQSNRLIDEGPNNFTLTRNGDVSVQAFAPFAPGLLSSNSHSVYFDGTGDYLSLANDAALNPGTEDFVMEAWVYLTGTTGSNQGINGKGTAGTDGYSFYITNGLVLSFIWNGTGGATITAGTLSLNTWHHVAVVRNSNVIRLYLDGIGAGSSTSCTTNITSTATKYVGQARGANPILGHISNYRMVKGGLPSGYDATSSSLTSPTTPLTAIANTSLLTCQSTTFVDNSTNAFTITPNGNAVPRKFNPFGQTYTSTAYSTANVGGSGYFDGSGDYINIAKNDAFNLGSGDFTIECWAHPIGAFITGTPFFGQMQSSGTARNSWTLRANSSGNPELSCSAGVNQDVLITSNVAISRNVWSHIAATREGTSFKLFVNGSLVGTATSSITLNHDATYGDVLLGASRSGATYDRYYNGLISGARLVKGTAVYTSAFTPPTSPPTNIANTAFLANFTNAGIFDQTAKNVLETVGDAKVSTAQYKYGTASMYFDGTGDYIAPVSNQNLVLRTGDFTIEFWLYPTNVSSGTYAILSNRSTGGGNSVFICGYGTSYGVYLHTQDTAVMGTSQNLTVNTWQHVAFVRSSGTLKIYLNGTSIGSPTAFSSDLSSTNPPLIGQDGTRSSPSANYVGYIDDLRITKGYARYTSNFTPPASALKDK